MVIRETTATLQVLFFKFVFIALSYVLIENGAFAVRLLLRCIQGILIMTKKACCTRVRQ